MYIKKVELKNFRNYSELSIDFNEKVNLILGNNAQGKTNLLESVYISSFGKSFRTNKDAEMIKFGEESAKIKVITNRDDEEENVELIIGSDQKKYVKVNGVKIKKTAELLNNILVVIFSPEDLKIVKDEPDKRRKFIDREICQINPGYYDSLSNYKKVLQQRNMYLKENDIDIDYLDVLDRQLSKYGCKIIHYRKNFIDKLNEISKNIHKKITNEKENLIIKYCPNIKYDEDIKEQEKHFYLNLKDKIESDRKFRTTSIGPQKDDLEFFINDVNVRNFGSQGQQRTTALSLKLAEINIIKEETGENPVLLLDDVMSELDLERQEFLVNSLNQVQLFITTTEIPDILINKFKNRKIIKVNNGNVE